MRKGGKRTKSWSQNRQSRRFSILKQLPSKNVEEQKCYRSSCDNENGTSVKRKHITNINEEICIYTVDKKHTSYCECNIFNTKGNNWLEFKNDAFYDSKTKNGHAKSIEYIICSNNTNASDSIRADNDVSFNLLNTCTEGTEVIYTSKCLNCTTVQSAYWCQVSARSNFNLAFLDLAANNYTNKSWEVSTFHMGESIQKTGDTNTKNLSEDMLHETNGSKIKWLLDYQRDELLASKSHNYASQEKSTWYLANSIDLLHIHSFSSYSFNSTDATDSIPQVICKYSRGREVEYNQTLKSKNITGVTNKNSTLVEKSGMIGRQFGYIPFTIKNTLVYLLIKAFHSKIIVNGYKQCMKLYWNIRYPITREQEFQFHLV